MHQAMLASRPIAQWRLESVRSGYEALLKRAGSHPAVAEVVRRRLALVARHEQAAQAASTIETILDRTRRRDHEIARVQERLAQADRSRTRPYNAIGYVQSSSREVEGRKLSALIGPDGSTVAFLDLPPGIDVDALTSQRVGVRGATHYNEDLGTRLITVRDVEAIEPRR
jgi:hypothetical protein